MKFGNFLLASVAAAALMSSTVGGGPGPGDASAYSLVYNSTTQVIGTSNVALTFNAVTEDGVGAYSGAQPTRLTIPAEYNGRYVRVLAGARVSRGANLLIRKNGASFQGTGGTYIQDNAAYAISGVVVSAATLVSTGEYFEVFCQGYNSGMTTSATETWMSIEVLSDTRWAKVHASGTLSLTANVMAATPFNTEDHDDGGWWTSGAATRFTAPADVSGLIRLSSGAEFASGSAETFSAFYKNGAEVKGGGYYETGGANPESMMSGPLTAASGDYFEDFHRTSNTQTRPASDLNWFEIEELDAAIKRAMVSRSSTLNIGSTEAAVTWDLEDHDDGGWWASGAPTRLTVPSGVTRVRLSGGLERASEGNQLRITVRKNGNIIPGTGSGVSSTTGADTCRLFTAALPVTPGDYFEMFAHGPQGLVVQNTARTWFAIEDMTNT